MLLPERELVVDLLAWRDGSDTLYWKRHHSAISIVYSTFAIYFYGQKTSFVYIYSLIYIFEYVACVDLGFFMCAVSRTPALPQWSFREG